MTTEQRADEAATRERPQLVAETAEIKRLALQPGDIIVVTLAYILPLEARVNIRNLLEGLFQGHKVLVLEGGAEISLIQPANEDEHAGN